MSRRQNPPREPPDLRQFAGKIYIECNGDSNHRYFTDPRGRTLLPGGYELSWGEPKVIRPSFYGSYVTPVTEALGLIPTVNRSHGSNRYGGLSYSSEWWVTRQQLTALRVADDLLRQEFEGGISWATREEKEAALVAAALAVMAATKE